jgi:hypothetical protein
MMRGDDDDGETIVPYRTCTSSGKREREREIRERERERIG